jgi:hypothetical protein
MNMLKGKLAAFVFVFVGYCIIFLAWNNWHVTNKEMAEMIFVGTLLGLFEVLAVNRIIRLIENTVRKLLT